MYVLFLVDCNRDIVKSALIIVDTVVQIYPQAQDLRMQMQIFASSLVQTKTISLL